LYAISYASNTFAKLFKFHAPFEIIANFAAHKHVRSEKDIFSIEALFYNNVINSHVLLEMLTKQPPSHFFCVSTDKAANPVNIMGASKKLMEEIIFAYLSDFKVTTARFANVAFSNGSLMDGFLKRIQKQQPISCPSDVTRFFVSDQEAGEICLMAAIMGNKGEIFFPKLSQENDLINFFDILKAMLKKQGLKPVVFDTEEAARQGVNILSKGEYPIYLFKTDTSGEKLYEEFYTEAEQVNFDQFQALGVIKKNNFYTKDKVKEIMSELTFLLGQENTQKKDIVSWLRSYLLRFDHIETGLSLDKKM
jgi:FlaA1/EpsC-like NDP-sugar epimerase